MLSLWSSLHKLTNCWSVPQWSEWWHVKVIISYMCWVTKTRSNNLWKTPSMSNHCHGSSLGQILTYLQETLRYVIPQPLNFISLTPHVLHMKYLAFKLSYWFTKWSEWWAYSDANFKNLSISCWKIQSKIPSKSSCCHGNF